MREIESASGISTFLKCPQAFKLLKLDRVPVAEQPKVEFGKWVHVQLENYFKEEGMNRVAVHQDVLSFLNSVNGYLDERSDSIIETEKTFNFELYGQKFTMIVDAITKKGIAIDYKVTASPGFYQCFMSYQAKIYNLGFEKLGLPYRYVFLLLEIDKKTQKFKNLILDPQVTSDFANVENKWHIAQILRLMKLCHDKGLYPPAYNNCEKCFAKDSCEYYEGF